MKANFDWQAKISTKFLLYLIVSVSLSFVMLSCAGADGDSQKEIPQQLVVGGDSQK